MASDIVMMRVLDWERHDYKKYQRWQRALDKAARVLQGRTAAPIADPFSREVKQRVVEQLKLLQARLRDRLARRRRAPTEGAIVAAFAEEARDLDLPFLSRPHNHELWIRFYRRDPIAHLHLSAEQLYDAFHAFVATHKDPDYVRKQISSLD